MGLKAPGNYLDQFWSNKISVLLLERLKPPHSMISGFLNPGEPVFMDLIYQITSNSIKAHGHIFKNIIYINLRIWNFENVAKSAYRICAAFRLLLFRKPHVLPILEKTGTEQWWKSV